MATTVSWDGLRELAGFRAEKGCAISFYVDLDPSVAPTVGDAQTKINSLLDEATKADGADPGNLTHEQREALKQDFARIRRYFENEFVREGAHGAVVFCAGLDDLWSPFALPQSIPDGVKVGRQLYLAPLVPLLGRGAGALVAVVGRERGQLYRLRGGRLEEVLDRSEEQPGQHQQGGWSQARFQRHIEHLVQEHLRDVADELDHQVRRLRPSCVVVVCADETRPELESLLSNETKKIIAGWTQAEAHATPAALLKAVEPVLESWHEQEEREVIERWREEAGRDGRASTGWAATLEAASDGKVEQLLFQEGVDRQVWQCPQCGRLAASAGECPLDGTSMKDERTGLDLAVHQTLVFGGTVLAIRHSSDLEPVEGIGALLRY